MSDTAGAAARIPVLDYLWNKYLVKVKDPMGDDTAGIAQIMADIDKCKGKREAVIECLRAATPFKRHLFEEAKRLHKIDEEAKAAIASNNADGITKAYFNIAVLLMNLKLWRGASASFEQLERSLKFTGEEKGFLDEFLGIGQPLMSGGPKTPEPLRILGIRNLDKKELWKEETLVNPDYEESPIRTLIRDYIKEKYGVERLGEFGGTNVPLPPGTHIKPKKVPTELPEIFIYTGMSQFLENKYDALRRSVYKPLANERHETGEYKNRALRFVIENDVPVENPAGKTTAEFFYIEPATLLQKLNYDIKIIEQSLLAGAKKVDKDYYFNIFFHLQTNRREDADLVEGAPPITGARFEPSEAEERGRFRYRISPEMVKELISVLMKVDQFAFGGHLDLDAYMDSIGIRRKPDLLLIEGEGLGCYEYTNNMLVIPTLCPFQMTPVDSVVSAFADFRFSLWTGSPKDIFNEQGVGFPVSGKRKKTLANKPLWSIFPAQSSSLIKQKAFREKYRQHILSHLFNEGVHSIAGVPIPTTNQISETTLRQYFTAYAPLAHMDSKMKKEAAVTPKKDGQPVAVSPAPAAAAPAASAPVTAPPQPAAPAPKAPPAPAAMPQPPKPAAPPSAPPAPVAPAPAASGVLCGNCGKALPTGSKFCLTCGTPVPMPTPKCVKCGEELPAGSRFCNVCGAAQA